MTELELMNAGELHHFWDDEINQLAARAQELVEKYKNLPSCYYTVDYAELADGTWKVIEAGDGSVSGLSENQNAEQYFRTLYYTCNE